MMIVRVSGFHFCFVGCSCLTILAFLVTGYLPMVDLPEHAVQLSIGQHWDDPAYGYQALYDFHFFVPKQVVYLLVLLLGSVFPLKIALKLAILGFVLAVPLTTGYMLKNQGLDPWLVFLAFPIAFSYSFYWGFISFLAATPLVIYLLVLVDKYSQAPSRAHALKLGLFFLLLFFTHPLAFGYAGLILGPLVLIRSPSVVSAVRRSLPLLLALSFASVWLFLSASGENIYVAPKTWGIGAGRLIEFLNQIVGVGNLTALLWGPVLLLVPFMMGCRFHPSWARRLPLALSLLVFFTFPGDLFSIAFLYGRFAVFTLPLLLFALQPQPGRPALSTIQKLVPVTLAVVWLSVLTVNFHAFGKEAREIRPVVQRIPPNKKVLYLQLDFGSRFVPGPVYQSFANWYPVERGGQMDPSFAGIFVSRFQYRSEINPDLSELFKSIQGETDWSAQAASYEYFIVRAKSRNPNGVLRRIGPTLEDRLEFVAKSGDSLWWLFRPIDEKPGH